MMAAAKKKPARRQTAAPVSRPANPERGEHEIVLKGKTYLLRPSYAAQVAIERQTRTYGELAVLAQIGRLSIEDAALAVTELINAGADGPMHMVNAERIGQLIYEEGLPRAAGILAVTLADALSGGRTAEGNAKPAAAKVSEDPATAG